MTSKLQALLAPLLTLAALGAPAAAQDLSGDTSHDNVVVVLDASGSMKDPMPGTRQQKMAAAKEAILEVLKQVAPTTHIGILVFSGRNVPDEWIYPLGPRNDELLEAAVQRPIPSGGTPLGEYLKKGADRLLRQRDHQHGYGSYRLLVVTDGQASDQNLVDRFLPEVLGRGLTVDVIGVAMQQTHDLATRVHSYRSADDSAALKEAIQEVFAEVQSKPGQDAQGEFDELEGFPDELALGVLEALGRFQNHPVGTKPKPKATPVAEATGSGPSSGTGVGPGSAPHSAPAARPSQPSAGTPAPAFVCVGMFGLVVVLALVMVKGRG